MVQAGPPTRAPGHLTGTDTLHTDDGVRLVASVRPADGTPKAAVVLAHGFAATTIDANVSGVADRLAANGYDVISFDLRGHGGSGGTCTLGDLEHLDVAAAVALARKHHRDVVTVGASMGAVAVLRHAADDPGLAGVVSVSAPAEWRMPRTARALLAAGLTRTRPGRWMASRHLGVRVDRDWSHPEPPVALVARMTAPLVVIHGMRDRFIPARQAERLAAAASGPTRLVLVPGMGHAFDPPGWPVVCDAIDWCLSAAHHRQL